MMETLNPVIDQEEQSFQSIDTVKVALLDEQPLFRLGLATYIKNLPGFSIVSDTSRYFDFLKDITRNKPDILIMDMAFNGQSDIEIIREIRSKFDSLPILVLSDFEEVVFAKQVIRAGANGYIMKSSPTLNVRDAVYAVLDGKIFLSERVYNVLLGEVVNHPDVSQGCGVNRLSAREFQVFLLMGKGLQPKEITFNLRLSRGTIEYDRKIMLKKLNLINLRQLRDFALSWVRTNRIN